MRRYESLKKTAELWYKEIPSNWNILRLKDITRSISSGATPSSGNAKYYNVGTINWLNTGDLNDGIVTNTSKKLNKEVFKDYPNLKIQKKGTLVIAMYGATIGKLGLLDIEATTNQACCCLNLANSFNSKYYFYLLLSNKQNIISLSVGGTQPNVSQSILSHIRLIFPPLEEQQSIANYLDAKTSAIDKKVTLLEQKIETYKKLKRTLINQTITKGLRSLSEVEMKDSGISWIGQIPKHWEVKRLKDIFIFSKGKNASFYNQIYVNDPINYGEYPVYSGQTENNGLMASINTFEYDSKNVVYLVTTVGAKAMELKELLGKFTLSQNCALIEYIKVENISKYIFYYLTQLFFEERKIIPTIMQPSLRIEDLEKYFFLSPPKSEQEEIANYLDHKTATIDAIISNISKQIETLKQLRKTLINDVVTGKIKVVK